MAIKVKQGGAYVDGSLFIKQAGAYSLADVFAKQSGAYAVAASSFSPQAIVIEGDNSMRRTTALSGVVNSQVGALSFVFRPTTDTTSFRDVIRIATTRVFIQLDSSKRLRVTVGNGTVTFVFRTTTQVLPTDGEIHFAVSWDTNAAAGAKTGVIMRNGVLDVEVFADAAAAFTPVLTTAPSIGADSSGNNPCPSVFKEVMCWLGEAPNWQDAPTLARVYASGQPVNPGDDGSLVTGTAPIIYLSLRGEAAPSTFLTNRGTGGDFIQATGTPTIRADTPFIPYGDSIVFGTGSTSFPADTWVFKTTRGLNTPRRRFNYGLGGENIGAIATRFNAAVAGHVAEFPKAIYVLEGGYNSLGQTTVSILGHAQSMVDALLAEDPNARFIFLGIPNGHLSSEGIGTDRYNQLVEINDAIETMVGASRFIDLREWLIANGLTAAGLSPTANDTADIGNGIVPRSLRDPDGSVHHNNDGQIAIGVAVREKLQALGWD